MAEPTITEEELPADPYLSPDPELITNPDGIDE